MAWLEQDGTPREIYEEPKNLFVARFIGEINVFWSALKRNLVKMKAQCCDTIEGEESIIYHDKDVTRK